MELLDLHYQQCHVAFENNDFHITRLGLTQRPVGIEAITAPYYHVQNSIPGAHDDGELAFDYQALQYSDPAGAAQSATMGHADLTQIGIFETAGDQFWPVSMTMDSTTKPGTSSLPGTSTLNSLAVIGDTTSHAADNPSAVQEHQCQQCGARFRRAPDLRRHLDSHDPDKRNPCSVEGCSYKGTYRRDKMSEHMRKRHPGVAT